MGNAGATNNPLADIPPGATVELVLDGVDLTIDGGELSSSAYLRANASGDNTWTITNGDGAHPFYRGKTPPCFVRSVVATGSVLDVRGHVVRPAADMRVEATQSTVDMQLDSEDEGACIECSMRDHSEFFLDGAVSKLTVSATDSLAALNVRCDVLYIHANSSSITGTQVANTVLLRLSDASKLRKLYVYRRADFCGTGAVMDVFVDPECVIENPPRWIPLATALARASSAFTAVDIERE